MSDASKGQTKGAAADEILVQPKLNNNFDANLEEGKVDIENNGVVFDAKMNTGGYNPEDIKIKITKTHIIIEGHHETEWESSEFYQEVIIPDGVSSSSIECTMNSKGILRITAPISGGGTGTGTGAVQTNQQSTKKEETVETTISQADSNTIDSKFQDSSNEIVKKQDAFEVALNVQDYQKEDIQVTVYKQVVTVKIQRKVTTSSTTITQESTNTKDIYKKYIVPEGTLPESITSTLDVQKKVLKITGKVVDKKNTVVEQQQQDQKKVTQTQQAVQQQSTKKVVTIRTIIIESEEFTRTTCENISQLIQRVVKEDVNYDTQIQLIIRKLVRNVKGDKLEVVINVPGYKPEEITIKITKKVIIIRARQETETVIRELFETVSLPKGVKPDSIVCTLDEDGNLTVSAPIGQEKPALPPAPAPSPVPTPAPAPTQQVQPASKPTSDTQVTQQQQQQITKEQSREIQQSQTQQTSQSHMTSTTTVSRQEQRIIQSGTYTSTEEVEEYSLSPELDTTNDLTPAKEPEPLEDVSKDVALVNEGKKFEVQIDVSQFTAEQVRIKIYKSTVVIKAKKEIKEETKTSIVQFYKKFTIPAGVKPENIQCTRTEKGILKISSTIETSSSTVTKSVQQKSTQDTQQQLSQKKVTDGKAVSLKPKILTGEEAAKLTQTTTSSTTTTKTTETKTYQVDDPTKFDRTLEVADYKPEEIEIAIANGWVIITGKQEMGEEHNFRVRQFTKKYQFPSGVKPEQISCTLANGTLTLTANPTN